VVPDLLQKKNNRGTVMKGTGYMVGGAYIYTVSVNDLGPTLKEFLIEYGHELIDGKWDIVVSGKIDFYQSLVYSRVSAFNKKRVEKKCSETQNPLDHVLLHGEIHNGVITSDILHLIDKVSTTKEKNGFYNLRVQSAQIYKLSLRCKTPLEFCQRVLKENGERKPYWYSFSIGNVIVPVNDRRTEVKALMRKERDPVVKAALHAKQTALKLIINTIYGVICSPQN
jgi:hypothetical protein